MDPGSDPLAGGNVSPVPQEIVGQLRNIVGCFADEVRGRMACSSEVAAMAVMVATQVALAEWRADRDETAQVVTDPGEWER